ncbi:MAG: hypothetical protein WDM71_01685 [Ferruginibacter sp.]
MKQPAEVNSIQFAQTIASYLGEFFITNHSVAKASSPLLSATSNK